MPYYEDEVFRYFQREIGESAEIELKELRDQIDSIKAEQLARINEEIQETIYKATEVELNEINLDYSAQTNRIRTASHKEIIKRKRDLIDSVLFDVQKKCEEFVSTKKYQEKMVLLVKHIDDKFCGKSMLFRIKKNDKVMKLIIESNFSTQYDIEEDEHILIGGFIAVCRDKNILTDQTIDYRLEEKKKWFHQNLKFVIKEPGEENK